MAAPEPSARPATQGGLDVVFQKPRWGRCRPLLPQLEQEFPEPAESPANGHFSWRPATSGGRRCQRRPTSTDDPRRGDIRPTLGSPQRHLTYLGIAARGSAQHAEHTDRAPRGLRLRLHRLRSRAVAATLTISACLDAEKQACATRPGPSRRREVAPAGARHVRAPLPSRLAPVPSRPAPVLSRRAPPPSRPPAWPGR